MTQLSRRAALCALVGGSCSLALGCGGDEDDAPERGLREGASLFLSRRV